MVREIAKVDMWRKPSDRSYFVAGSDARIIKSDDEGAALRFWREKQGDVDPENLCGNVVVQLGVATEDLNRRRYECITGRMPVGWYIVSITYATALILLAQWPWNILLILLLFPYWGSSRGSSL